MQYLQPKDFLLPVITIASIVFLIAAGVPQWAVATQSLVGLGLNLFYFGPLLNARK